jgi:hypothetical protein
MPNTLHNIVEKHKGVRRLALLWGIVIVTIVILRVTEPEVIVQIGMGGATIVTAVIGILGTVLGLYQYHRHEDDVRRRDEEEH